MAEPVADDDILDGDEAVVARILRRTVEWVRLMRSEPWRLRANRSRALGPVAARAGAGVEVAAAWLRAACAKMGYDYDEVLAEAARHRRHARNKESQGG